MNKVCIRIWHVFFFYDATLNYGLSALVILQRTDGEILVARDVPIKRAEPAKERFIPTEIFILPVDFKGNTSLRKSKCLSHSRHHFHFDTLKVYFMYNWSIFWKKSYRNER